MKPQKCPEVLTEIFPFIFVLIYSYQKSKLIVAIKWFQQLLNSVNRSHYFVTGLPETILKLIFFSGGDFFSWSEVLFVNEEDFVQCHFTWSKVQFFNGKLNYFRVLKIVPTHYLRKNSLIISNNTLFNIKNNLKVDKYFLFNQNSRILFKIVDSKKTFYHDEASKLVVKFFSDSYQLSNNYLYKTLENFVRLPKFMQKNDVIAIDLSLYGLYFKNGQIHFVVVQIEGSDSEQIERNVYAVTQSTSIYNEKSVQGYIPSSKWELIENDDIKSLSPILPLGLEDYFNRLLKWFTPFYRTRLENLAPVFILSGKPGCGKSTVLEAVSKSLGIGFNRLDCSNILANSQAQINANIKTIMKNLLNHSPCILNLYNVELLSINSEGIDTEQILLTLTQNIKSLKTAYPFVIVFTCEDVNKLKEGFINLSLQQLHISHLNEQQRNLMIIWLAHRYKISVSNDMVSYINKQSSSFSMNDMKKLLCLSEKERIRLNHETIALQHVKTVLEQMNVVGKGGLRNIDWEDIGGVEAIKKEVLSSLFSSQLMSVKRTGLLLHGPPGTGKTLLARAVASRCGRAFISVKGPELLNMYVGQSEANIRQIFSRAKEASPCIIFFDELDSLAPNRGNKSDSGGVMDRVVSQLLTEMDELDISGNVFVLGATNRPDLIDPALLRPGRFDKMIYVGPCEDKESKIKVLTALVRNFQMEEVEFENLVNKLPDKITGANLYAICSTAWTIAAKDLIKSGQVGTGVNVIVRQRDFEKALSDVDITF